VAARLAAAANATGSLAPSSALAGGGSNNWVVSGARSTTGKPLLANDPHLPAGLPSVWYLAHLQGGPLDAIGATMPGTPGMPIGHNARIAWGVTSLMPDVQDLYIERLDAQQRAEYQGAWEPMQVTHEVIRVKDAPDETLAVRATRHGPLVSDVVPGAAEALALRWTALDAADNIVESFRALSLAGTWEAFTVAVAGIATPALNFVYADVDGNIGYFAPGALPIRPHHDGTLPVPGWTGEFEWAGFVPPDRLPRIYNPTRGFVATANNQALPDDYPHVLSTNWEPGYRAERITQLIESRPQLSADDFARMQADVRTPQVGRVLPWMRRAQPTDDASRAAMTRLSGWDGSLESGSAEAALFMAWIDALVPALFADELGDVYDDWAQWPPWRAKALDAIVSRADDRWCDDVRTAPRETCESVIARALRDGLDHLAEAHGSGDPARWRWGDENRVPFRHAPFDAVWFLRPLFSRAAPAGGNSTTINKVERMPMGTVVASYRQIVDLARLDASRFAHVPGQSGQLGSPHYADLLEVWRRVDYVPMLFSRAAVDAAVVDRLALEPAR
jgi:penicillin amidase